jgi:hypothetical protein
MEKISIESFQVAQIENQAVSLGDRPLVKGIRGKQREKVIGSLAGVRDSL